MRILKSLKSLTNLKTAKFRKCSSLLLVRIYYNLLIISKNSKLHIFSKLNTFQIYSNFKLLKFLKMAKSWQFWKICLSTFKLFIFSTKVYSLNLGKHSKFGRFRKCSGFKIIWTFSSSMKHSILRNFRKCWNFRIFIFILESFQIAIIYKYFKLYFSFSIYFKILIF